MNIHTGTMIFVNQRGSLCVCDDFLEDGKPRVLSTPKEMGKIVSLVQDDATHENVILNDKGMIWVFDEKEEDESFFCLCDVFHKKISFLAENVENRVITVVTNDGEPWTITFDDGCSHFDCNPIECPREIFVSQIFVNDGSMVIVDHNGCIYGRGENLWSQLGMGERNFIENFEMITKPKDLGRIVSIHLSSRSMYILDDCGFLWVCGVPIHERMERNKDYSVLQKVTQFPLLKSLSVCCSHLLGVDLHDNVYVSFYNKKAFESNRLVKIHTGASGVHAKTGWSFVATFRQNLLTFNINDLSHPIKLNNFSKWCPK